MLLGCRLHLEEDQRKGQEVVAHHHPLPRLRLLPSPLPHR